MDTMVAPAQHSTSLPHPGRLGYARLGPFVTPVVVGMLRAALRVLQKPQHRAGSWSAVARSGHLRALEHELAAPVASTIAPSPKHRGSRERSVPSFPSGAAVRLFRVARVGAPWL